MTHNNKNNKLKASMVLCVHRPRKSYEWHKPSRNKKLRKFTIIFDPAQTRTHTHTYSHTNGQKKRTKKEIEIANLKTVNGYRCFEWFKWLLARQWRRQQSIPWFPTKQQQNNLKIDEHEISVGVMLSIQSRFIDDRVLTLKPKPSTLK